MIRKLAFIAFACLAAFMPLETNAGTKEFMKTVDVDLVGQLVAVCVDGPEFAKTPMVALAQDIDKATNMVNDPAFRRACGKVMFFGASATFIGPDKIIGDEPVELSPQFNPVLAVWHDMDACQEVAQKVTIPAFAELKSKIDPTNRITPVVFCYNTKVSVLNEKTRDMIIEMREKTGGKRHEV